MLYSDIKHYKDLSTDELYRIIQLRIEGFIVRNKTCYQDLEDKYDKLAYHIMWYDSKVGFSPDKMVGYISLCYSKTFVADDGIHYTYPTPRRQAWLDEYKGGCSTRDFLECQKLAKDKFHSPNLMLEITNPNGKQIFLDQNCKEVGTNIDPAGRKNWIFVYEDSRTD